MKNFLKKAAVVVGLLVLTFILVKHLTHERGPLTTFVFEFDVPTKDGHTITIDALVDYRLSNNKVILSSDEAEDRVYSNVLTAFRLATTGVPFEKIQGESGEEKLEDEVLKRIEYYNESQHEVVEIESIEFSMEFDPPASEFDPSSLEEGVIEEEGTTPVLGKKQLFLI